MSSLTPPPNLSLVIATSSLQSALDKLLQNDFSALDLPIDPTDSMWERLEKDFQLTLGQLSALRNYVKTSSISITHSPTSSALPTGKVVPPPETTRSRRRKTSQKKVEVQQDNQVKTKWKEEGEKMISTSLSTSSVPQRDEITSKYSI